MNNVSELVTMSPEARRAMAQRGIQMHSWSHTLSKDQLAYLCDAGWYNNTIKGYLIASALNAGLSEDTIDKLLDSLTCALSDYSKREAEKFYLEY